MFDKTARYYDLLYEKGLGKDYAAEADAIAALLPGVRTLLDVACGTGLHLQYLASRFDCEGVDLDDGMLALARDRCPGVPLHHGDMATFDLTRTFDAVVCLFSSVGYLRTEERLRAGIANLAAHLVPGGTLIVEPWLTPDVFVDGTVHSLHVDEPDLKITRMGRSTIDGEGSAIEFHYLIGTRDGIEHLTERHVLGLFAWDAYRRAFEDAGLETVVQTDGGPMGRGLVRGTRATGR